jgi:endo-1,4-beta-D-glucanase Y
MELFKFKKNKTKKASKEEWIQYLLQLQEHKWLDQDRYVRLNLLDFLEDLPQNVITKMCTTHPTVLVPATGRFSCAVNSHKYNVILIFPELMDLLKSTAITHYKAILAHELGHILLSHGKREVNTLEAQVEADMFACKLGFVEDLENFLLEQPESVEKRVRLSYITSYYFS